jgi:tetratricopeptide (TPR) repeat protein
VGLTVFKTAGGPLGAVPGGFDSHTPLFPFVLLSSFVLTQHRNSSVRIHKSLSRISWIILRRERAAKRRCTWQLRSVSSGSLVMIFRTLNLLRETVNIFAALQIASEHHHYADLVRGVNAFTSFLDARGLYAQAEELLARAREVATLLDDRVSLAETLLHSGDIMVRQGNYGQAQAYLQEGLALAREIDRREHLTGLLQSPGMLAQRQGNYAQAEAYLQEGLALARQMEDRSRICLLLKNLGTLEAIQGNYAQAEAYLQEGLMLAEQIGDHETMSLLLLNSGQLASERGNLTQAEICFQEALRLAQQIGHREAISLLLTNLGVLAGEQKDYVRAQRYLLSRTFPPTKMLRRLNGSGVVERSQSRWDCWG